MRQIAIRGATTTGENSKEAIDKASLELVQEIAKLNDDLRAENITTVFITMTEDLTARNASTAVRSGMDWDHVPFFTSQEPNTEGALPLCIRVLIHYYTEKKQSEIQHVYLNEATRLRPDLAGK